ncbi:MAG: preprotein translocase subunit SecG [Gammaproteobacteria bacterium]|nr:MAG: preprotein translocase subunit SecG [Gammaproteobacteria bacterium]
MIEIALLIGLVVVAFAVVGLVLLQQGKGADMGASFGSGASQTLFGSQGSGNFLTRSTWILAFVFFALCLGLAMIARDKAESAGRIDFEQQEVVEVPQAPAVESEIPAVADDAAVSDVPVVEEDMVSDIPAEDASVAEEPAGESQ